MFEAVQSDGLEPTCGAAGAVPGPGNAQSQPDRTGAGPVVETDVTVADRRQHDAPAVQVAQPQLDDGPGRIDPPRPGPWRGRQLVSRAFQRSQRSHGDHWPASATGCSPVADRMAQDVM